MSEKSPLEMDVERRELLKVPFGAVFFIALLLICIGMLGFYAYRLRQIIAIQSHEIILLKSDLNKKETKFTNQILRLERENRGLRLRLEPQKEIKPEKKSLAQ
jgi:hypothetical protein